MYHFFWHSFWGVLVSLFDQFFLNKYAHLQFYLYISSGMQYFVGINKRIDKTSLKPGSKAGFFSFSPQEIENYWKYWIKSVSFLPQAVSFLPYIFFINKNNNLQFIFIFSICKRLLWHVLCFFTQIIFTIKMCFSRHTTLANMHIYCFSRITYWEGL